MIHPRKSQEKVKWLKSSLDFFVYLFFLSASLCPRRWKSGSARQRADTAFLCMADNRVDDSRGKQERKTRLISVARQRSEGQGRIMRTDTFLFAVVFETVA